MAINDGGEAAPTTFAAFIGSALLIAVMAPGVVMAWFSDTFQSRERVSDAPSGVVTQIVFAAIFWICLGALAWKAVRH